MLELHFEFAAFDLPRLPDITFTQVEVDALLLGSAATGTPLSTVIRKALKLPAQPSLAERLRRELWYLNLPPDKRLIAARNLLKRSRARIFRSQQAESDLSSQA